MIIQTHIHLKEYMRLMYRMAYRKPVMIGLVIFDLLMVSWVTGFYLGLDTLPEPEYPQYMAIFLISVVQPVGIYITIRQNYNSSARLHDKQTIELLEKELRITGKSFYIQYNWNNTFRVLELRDWILVYENTFTAVIIPKRLLSKKQLKELKLFIQTIPDIRLRLKPE